MRRRTARALVTLLAVGVPVGALTGTIAASAASSPAGSFAPPTNLSYTGDAYGTYAFVGNTVVAGKSALSQLGCTTTAGIHNSNTISTVSAPPLLTTGVINSTADSIGTPTSVESLTTADVNGANVLGGLISATEVKAVSATSDDATGFHLSAAGSMFANLVVAGVPILVNPAPNTTIALPGVGRVVLNEQTSHIGTNNAKFTVNMIHVYVTLPLPGIAQNTQIIVAHATSDLELFRGAVLDGHAYGTKANVGTLVVSGPTAVVRMPCGGTRGRVHTNSVASVSVPGILSTGTVTDTAQGTVTTTSASGETTSTVQALALAGLVTGDAIKADAHASETGGVVTLSDAGSAFVNLVVAGMPIAATVPPNTKITIAGITVWLHRVMKGVNHIQVRMIEVVVTGANAFGLALNTDVQVAVAEASVH